MNTTVTVLTGALLLAMLAPAQAESLYEKRLAIIKGTSPGITLIGPASKPTSDAAGSNPTGPAASAPAPSTSTAAQTAPSEPEEPGKSWLQRLNAPPSGKSLAEAKRLDAPDQGIRIPTARTAASQPADGGPAKR